ncbi:MAG: hypothetical protein JST93_22330 [Acidobacteria bacterium]|nr:hypothetical protein [Acidobacteriota bacterium]
MQTHYGPCGPPPANTDWDKDTRCLWSLAPSGKLVIFIHGYKGQALATWSQFDRLLLTDTRFQDADCIFYGYDGLRTELIASSAGFFDFLNQICGNSADFVNPWLPPELQRPAKFRYKSVLIVAHSLGAVVTRKALVFAYQQKMPWLRNVRMALFAPAHMGASIVNLAFEAISSNPLTSLLGIAVRFVSPLIDQLNPDKSTVLPVLRKEIEDARKKGGNSALSASRVFIASRENVVKNDPFPYDPAPIRITGTHTTICKPDSTTHKAFAEIGDLL